MDEPSTVVHLLCTVTLRFGEARSSAVSAVISFVVLAMSIGVSAFFSASTAPDPAWSTIIASAEVPGGENTAGAEAENRIAAARARITVFFINKHHPWIDSGGA